MDKKTQAIFEVRLGLRSITDAAAFYKLTPTTLKRWIDGYKPPTPAVITDLLAEALVKRLMGDVKGSEFTGIVKAYVLIGAGSATDLLALFSGDTEDTDVPMLDEDAI